MPTAVLKNLQGHRFMRTASDWVIKKTNSKTVSLWLLVDFGISAGLGAYFFFFRYVSSLGWVPIRIMNNFKFYIFIAGVRALCTLWGMYSVLVRDVKSVKLFYSVFMLNLLVAVWLMIPLLSLNCTCSQDYYQCEALQSFALDGLSLNKWPEPEGFGKNRRVEYKMPPTPGEPELDATEDKEDFELTTTVSAQAAVGSEAKAKEASNQTAANVSQAAANVSQAAKQEKQEAEEVAAAKNLAADSQKPESLLQSGPSRQAKEETISLDVLSGGHQRLVSKRRNRRQASLLQTDQGEPAGGQPAAIPQAPPVVQPAAAPQAAPAPPVAASAPAPAPTPPAPTPTPKADAKVATASPEAGSKAALEQLSDPNLHIGVYFKPVGETSMLKSAHPDEGVQCASSVKEGAMWDGDKIKMSDLLQGKKITDRDASFMATIRTCITEEACAGIFWRIAKAADGSYNSSACTMIDPVSEPLREPAEPADGVIRTVYLTKNKQAVKELIKDGGRKANLMSKIFQADTEEQVVDFTEEMHQNMCRCQEKSSCKSYADIDGAGEIGWCYIDNKTLHICQAAEKEIFYDAAEDLHWTRDICHQGESYEASCQCSSIGMLPPNGGVKVDKDLVQSKPYEYGSYCEKWNGADNAFKWCFVGWDSPCVDRRRAQQANQLYKDRVPNQFWSNIACDTDKPNVRLIEAIDKCENLEYTADGVCIFHILTSIPMIMVLYNFISNQCGDDIQTEEQFTVGDSSSDEDAGDEFEPGQGGAESKRSSTQSDVQEKKEDEKETKKEDSF
ncbi:unnamed protein product [Effrenium voratum]|uniref:Uncharacterized protein n=1 Tax=Effrenium voratum TaxID=2562239 RepID=A0AA36NJ29_9DINO|nr:unnamed protein product [Effrenium voratum]